MGNDRQKGFFGPWRLLAGGALLAVSVFGIVYAARASISYAVYYSAKYGDAAMNAAAVLERCERASSLYRFNYHLCSLATHTAYDAYQLTPELDAPARARLLALTRAWCQRGLALNWYNRDLRWYKAQLLWEESPAKGLEFWREYVEWDFWFPANHAVLAGMYARSGDFENARKELGWTQGSDWYPSTSETIAQEEARRAASR